MRKFCTIDDLYEFCRTNNFTKFNATDYDNKPLILQSIECFEVADTSKDGLLPVTLKACHIGRNRNQSAISEDNMRKYMGSFKGRPILGAIHKTDTGEYEFHAHDVEFMEDGDGETEIKYIEQPVGVISEILEPYLKYDAEQDKTYLMVSGNIFEDYSQAAEILQRHRTCKCSVEIAVEQCSWDAKEEVLNIEAFSFRGVTILGYEQDGVTEIEEGMKGSAITLDSFSERNSMFANNYQARLVEALDRLNQTLSKFSINTNEQKGVETEDMGYFEELLEKYEVSLDDVKFEHEGLSNEELDALFEEHFGCKKKKCESDFEDESSAEGEDESGTEDASDDENDSEDEGDPQDDDSNDEGNHTDEGDGDETGAVDDPEEQDTNDTGANGGCIKKGNYEISDDLVVVKYELSHEDIHYGLYNLLDAEGVYGWILEVWDSSFLYQDWDDAQYYKRGYSVENDTISLAEGKTQVFNQWLTKEEIDALEQLKRNYAQYKQYKDEHEAEALRAQKNAILDDAKFSALAESEAFAALRKDIDHLSLEEIEVKAKTIFADYVINTGKFSAKSESNTPVYKIGMNYQAKGNKKKAYGNLFD